MADWFSTVSRRVNAATADRQREAAVRAARLAVDRLPPQDPTVAEAATRLGVDAATAAAELDRACEALEERSMESGDEEAAFVAARVAFAVRAALDPDPRQAALDAIYESAIAIADDGAVVAAVDDLLPEDVSPGWYAALNDALLELDDDRRRQVSAALVELLLERVPLAGKPVERALKAVRAGNTGPSLARRALNRYRSGLTDDDESMAAFALWSALRSDPLDGAQTVAFAVSTQLGDDPAVAQRLAALGVLGDR